MEVTGNICFKKPNIYPCIGEKPRWAPEDNLPYTVHLHASAHQGGWKGRVVLSEQGNQLGFFTFLIINKWSAFQYTWSLPLSVTQSPSTPGTAYQHSLAQSPASRMIQHYPFPWGLNSSLLVRLGNALGHMNLGPLLVCSLVSYHWLSSNITLVFGPGHCLVLTLLPKSSKSFEQ